MKNESRSFLVRKVDGIGRSSMLVDHITRYNILHHLPKNIVMEATFKWEAKEKKSVTFTIDKHGRIDSQSAICVMKPGAKVTIEWEE